MILIRLRFQTRVDCQMLRTQYRMHPAICNFSNNGFYHGQIESATGNNVQLLQGFWSLSNWPLVLLDIDSREEKANEFLGRGNCHDHGHTCSPFCMGLSRNRNGLSVPKSASFFNCGQAYVCIRAMWTFLRDPAVKSITIISTYKAQQIIIDRMLDQLADESRERRPGAVVESATVDSFQGQEADVIILCTVRNNDSGYPGHIRDPRRLNVAVTRAKHALAVVGCVSFLHAASVSDEQRAPPCHFAMLLPPPSLIHPASSSQSSFEMFCWNTFAKTDD